MLQTILSLFPADVTPINNLLLFAKRDGMIYCFHGCFPVFCHDEDDVKSFRMFREEVLRLKEKRRKTPRHVTIADLPEGEKFTQLTPTRKHFIDTIRMIAYGAETAMAILLRDVLARSDDARSFLRELFTSEADLIPNIEIGTLTVRLHHIIICQIMGPGFYRSMSMPPKRSIPEQICV